MGGWVPWVKKIQNADSQTLVTPGPLKGQGQVKDSDFQKIRRSCPVFLLMSGKKLSWVWASSVSWWWTGKPGVLQSMGSQKLDTTQRLNWKKHLPAGIQRLFSHQEEPPTEGGGWAKVARRKQQTAETWLDISVQSDFASSWTSSIHQHPSCLVCSSVWHADNYIAVLIDFIIESHRVRLFHEFVPINSSV